MQTAKIQINSVLANYILGFGVVLHKKNNMRSCMRSDFNRH